MITLMSVRYAVLSAHYARFGMTAVLLVSYCVFLACIVHLALHAKELGYWSGWRDAHDEVKGRRR